MERRYNVGLYLRLSVEDSVNSQKRNGNPFQHESTSIENQRDILTEYVNLQGWDVTKVYPDDGWSGGGFNRPQFQEMIRDAEAGLIDLILVKDLSRLGRDHIEVDHYVEDVFPSLGVRFIALMDNIDSEGGSDILPFRSLLNDYHLKDLSRKIKSVLYAKAKAGEYVGAFAPYGFKKDPERHGRLAIDPYAAVVVRRIFDLRLQRLGYAKIAGILNGEGVLAPRAYCYASEGKANPYKVVPLWQYRTVKVILENEVYLGHSVKMKKGTLSYKNKTFIDRPKENWIRVEDTHEAIISQEVWDAVQAIDLRRSDPAERKKPERSLFAGLLFCDNGHSMVCNTGTKRRNEDVKKHRSYSCGLYRRTGGAECSWHTISEEALLRIVREDVQRQLERISVDEQRVVNEIQSRLTEVSLEETKKGLRKLFARLEELEALGAKLYEDRLNGVINLDTFMRLSADAEAERETVQAEHERLSKALETAERQALDINRWISSIRSYLAMDAPDTVTLRELIKRIEIGERESKSKGKGRRQAVKIIYRFVGSMGGETNGKD